ncbi:hypothetical protein CXQ85_003720 [Candidozyma haemuli]|uniref:Amino acid permease/ SLC12A domain-containing protein n=1 Tax=Candidozyma haemuli TaxID=45357 RepID=A0A2V1AQ43_9ASCO|nr:hypothetical protein CXQ85_003720 [[Candida] haemuloni]PVH19862.1 hypothetical protein CXQ85_003720 [[Candida] haemuloni]
METEKKSPAVVVNEEFALGENESIKDFQETIVPDYGSTKRKLTARHVSLMIIGQSIGTGLFVGVKTPLMTSGSLSLFLGFFIWAATMIWPLMLATGEMCSYLPVRGTFLHFAARWLDPAMGFAVTMMYLYTTLMFICVEAVAFASVAGYWTDLSPAVDHSLFNVFGVNWYGEVEFVSSMLKVILIVGLMFFGLITMCGGNPKGDAYGFRNWSEGGLVKAYLVEGSTGKFLGFWNVMIFAAFSCGGPDMLGMISGEISQPRQNIAMAAKRTYVRIFLFYVGGIFFMNSMCASNNPDLVAASDSGQAGAAASPWVIGIKSVGVYGLDSVVNAVVMTSAWSCGNGFTYGAARSAYSAALAGYIPRVFSYCLKSGCPIVAVLFSMAIGCLSYMTVSKEASTVLDWFISLATTGLLCTFAVMWMCYFKFKKAVQVQVCDYEDKKYYKVNRFLYPWVTYWAALLNGLVLIFNGFWVFFPGQFSVANLFTSYFAPVFFVVLFVFWKFWKKTHWRSDMEADITSGKEEIDDEEEAEKAELALQPRKNGLLWKAWYKFADFCFS